jgi:hypothetical protein
MDATTMSATTRESPAEKRHRRRLAYLALLPKLTSLLVAGLFVAIGVVGVGYFVTDSLDGLTKPTALGQRGERHKVEY